jgi:2-dehydropantoate 2-reductase
MNIVIIGAGALGSLLAARLCQAGADVSLFDYHAERASSLQNKITLQENKQDYSFSLPVTSKQSCLKQADLVLLCTKSGDVEKGVALFRQNAPTHAYILGFQNGISHINAIKNTTHGGFAVTAQGATLLAPGYVRHGGSGPTVIGCLSCNRDTLAPFARFLTSAHIPTTVTADIESSLWQKLIINVGINGLTVLYNCPNGELLHIPKARKQLLNLVSEGIAVATALGIKTEENPLQHCLEVCRATSTNISSMLQDFRNHKKSEIMAINGALVHEAQKVGIATPENEKLIQNVLKMWPQNI